MRSAIWLKWVFTIGSMALSGLFGYLSAEGVMGLNLILATIFAGVAFGLAWAVEQRAYSLAVGDTTMAKIMAVIAIPCLVFNTIADYSSAAAVRNIVATKIGDLNRVTNDKVGEVRRLEQRIAEIKGQAAWKTTYLSPDAYQSEIDNLQSDGIIVKRSKNCTDQTLPDTRVHCGKIATAKAHKSMAEERQRLDKEINDLGLQLAKAKEASGVVTTHANATEAATRAYVSWALLTRNLSEDNTVWGQNSMLLFSTAILMLLIAGLSHYIGTVEGREHMAAMSRGGQEDFTFVAPQLPGPAAARAPIPLKAEPIPAGQSGPNMVVIDGREQRNSTQTDALIAAALAALKKYETSPFAKQEGAA